MSMTVAVTPDEGECQKLAADALAYLTQINNRMKALTPDPNVPPPQEFWNLQIQQHALVPVVQEWLVNGVAITLGNAGQAVDVINASTEVLDAALRVQKSIATDVAVVTAFVKLAVAIAAGMPGPIITTGKAFIDELKAASPT